jgi:hypothetical protein
MAELTTTLQLDEESNHFHTAVPWHTASMIGLEKGGRSSGRWRTAGSSGGSAATDGRTTVSGGRCFALTLP